MRFENQEDLNREERAVQLFVKAMTKIDKRYKDVTVIKLGDTELDFLIDFNGQKEEGNINVRVKSHTVEIKGVRGLSLDDNHTPIVSMLKGGKMVKSVNSNRFGESHIVFAYTDGIKFQELRNLKGYFQWGGRKSRIGAANDQELILKFSSTDFHSAKY